MSGLLRGTRVIEVGVLMTVDHLGRLLGDEGADVVKVEEPQVGDYLRNIMTRFAPDWSAFHLILNRNKRSVAVDVRTSAGRDVMARLLAGADVLITGNVGATNAKLGLDYDAVRRIKPDIVYCQATGFGATGPYAEVPTHGQMMDDLGGSAPRLEVSADGTTHVVPGSQSKPLGVVLGPLYAAFGVAAALARRGISGEGAYLDVSCADAVLAGQCLWALPELNPDKVDAAGPLRGRGESAKYQYYETKDQRFLLFCAIEAKFWDHFCRAVDREDLRGEHRRDLVVDFAAGDQELRAELQTIFRSRTLAEWMHTAVEYDIAMGPALDLSEVRDDPQLAARGMIATERHPVVGAFSTLGNPVLVSGEEMDLRSAPALGEHTDEVLQSLGFRAADIDEWRAAGSVR
jgi:formyl-CoA transferase